MRVFLRGDCHGDITWAEDWCKTNQTTTDDILIILGDFGINFWLNKSEQKKKQELSKLPITIMAIQGNHEKRPEKGLLNYQEVSLKSGEYWYEPQYPNILFMKNGIHCLAGKTFLICDGAYSIDKYHRIARGTPWFEDEQMSDDDMETLFTICDNNDYFDFVLSHTAPMNHEPLYLFLPYVDQSRVDKHTEWILQEIYDKIEFGHWYFGHYHDTNLEYKPNMSILYDITIQII